MMLQVLFFRYVLRGHVSLLGGRGRFRTLFLTNQADNLLHLAFGEIVVRALWTRLNRSWGHKVAPGP